MSLISVKRRTLRLSIVNKFHLWKYSSLKILSQGVSVNGGRNNQGKTTIWHKGGGHKRILRNVLNFYSSFNSRAVVCRLEYDPNRTGWIALLQNDNRYYYTLAARGMQVGDVLTLNHLIPGNSMELRKIPSGALIYNLEPFPKSKAIYIKSAGSSATLVSKNILTNLAIVRFPSGLRKLLSLDCTVSLGCISNHSHKDIVLGLAGRSRWLNRRPIVRGVAMNPIDHPHGGGEGKTAAGRHPVTPWGKLTKGKVTRNVKKPLLYIVK